MTNNNKEIPNDWSLVALGNVLPINYGKARSQEFGMPRKETKVYGSSGVFDLFERALTSRPSLIIGRKGSIGSIHLSNEPCWPIDTTYFVEATQNTFLPFYYYLLRHFDLAHLDKSTAIPGLSRDDYNALVVSIPSLREQKAVTKTIEELFSDLDNAVENLQKAREQLKVYRQSILKNAFEGKLTEEWRRNNKQLPSASQLREEINTERKNYDKVKGKKTKAIVPLSDAELSELWKLPPGWFWVKLGEITHSVKDGPHYSPKYQEKGVPFISGGNVRPEGVDFKNVKYISEELNRELNKRCKPEVGNVLYTKGGTTGIARVNTYDFEFNVWVHVAVLKILNMLEPFYVQHALNSHHCYKQSQKYTHGVGNQDLGLTRMINITLPICSPDEQKQIVTEIESRFSVCDRMEETIETSLKQAEALRQSILKQAFEGKLTEQWRKDHPDLITGENSAAALIAKIKAEREKTKR